MSYDILAGCMKALACGLVVGGVFGAAGVAAPAPPTTEGVLGVAGIALGWFLAKEFLK